MSRWSRRNGRGERYVVVEPWQVVVGEHHGSGHTDHAGTCSHLEFWSGTYQDLVREHFDEATLQRVLALVEDPDRDPELRRRRAKDRALADRWAELPELAELLAAVDAGTSARRTRTDGRLLLTAGSLTGEATSMKLELTDGEQSLVIDALGNRWEIGNDVRVGDLVAHDDRLLARVTTPFSPADSPLRQVLGQQAAILLGLPGGLVARARLKA